MRLEARSIPVDPLCLTASVCFLCAAVFLCIAGDLGQIEPDGSSESSQMDGSILTTVAMAADFADGTVFGQKGGTVFYIGTAARAAIARSWHVAGSWRLG